MCCPPFPGLTVYGSESPNMAHVVGEEVYRSPIITVILQRQTLVLHHRRQRGYVFTAVCLFVSVCQQDYEKKKTTAEQIYTKLGGQMGQEGIH